MRGEQGPSSARRMSRDRVIAAIYETVLRPDRFGEFMDVWREHIQAELERFDGDALLSEEPAKLGADDGMHAHFSRAYAILEQFGRQVSPQSLEQSVADSPHVNILMQADGAIVATSEAARGFLEGDGGLVALTDRLNGVSSRLLQEVLTEAWRGGTGVSDAVLVTDRVPRHLIVRLVPQEFPGQDLHRQVCIEALDYVWTDRAQDMLVTSFNLSPAEVDVVRNLLAGRSLKEIAAASDRSEHTLRNQAKSVLSKTGAPSQADLIRLVAYLLNQDAGAPAPKAAGNPGVKCQTMQMTSGLDMQVFQAGAADARPVLFLNGILDGSAPVRHLEPHLAERGLRMIAPVRPGFGESGPSPAPERMADLFLDHVVELVRRLDLDRPVLLGNMTGCVFAHILSCYAPDLFSGLVAVSGGVPILRLRQVQRMAPRQRAVFYTARFTPNILPTVLRAGIAQLDRGDTEAFMTAMHREGTTDLALIRDRGLEPLIQSGYRETVLQGHRGFADEALFMVRDWSDRIAGPGCPALFLSGARDPVVDPQDIRRVMEGRPGTRVRVLPDTGQLILYDRPDLVLDHVMAMFA